MCGTLPPGRTSDLPSLTLGQHLGATGDAFPSAKALMKDKPVPIKTLPGDFVAPDDAELFAFIHSLRNSVRIKVAAGQQRGLSLAEIVVQVREMVRFAEEDPTLPKAFPPTAFRAMTRQAVAWCIEAYNPMIIAEAQREGRAREADSKALLQLLTIGPDTTPKSPSAQ